VLEYKEVARIELHDVKSLIQTKKSSEGQITEFPGLYVKLANVDDFLSAFGLYGSRENKHYVSDFIVLEYEEQNLQSEDDRIFVAIDDSGLLHIKVFFLRDVEWVINAVYNGSYTVEYIDYDFTEEDKELLSKDKIIA
jgi:hypothetical protein